MSQKLVMFMRSQWKGREWEKNEKQTKVTGPKV